MKSSKRKLRPAMVVTIVFVCIAVVLTFFSKTIYGMMVPTVHVVQFTNGSLLKTHKASAIVIPRQVREIYVPQRMIVKEVLVNENDAVKRGDVLVKLDVSELEMQLGERQADYEKLPETAKLDAENAQRRIDALQQLIDDFGEVKSPVDGEVVSVNAAVGTPADPEVCLVSVFDPEEGYSAKCVMAPEVAEPFSKRESVKIERRGGSFTSEGKISHLRMTDDGNVEFTVDIFDTLQSGEMINLFFSKNTPPYENLVPLEALFEDGYIYIVESKDGLLGEEYVARRIVVQVLDTDNTMAAIDGEFNDVTHQIVVASDRALTNGQVQIYHED